MKVKGTSATRVVGLLLLCLAAALPASAGSLYTNVTSSSNTSSSGGIWLGWNGAQLADSFTLSSASTITGIQATFWYSTSMIPGEIDWITWSINQAPFKTALAGGTNWYPQSGLTPQFTPVSTTHLAGQDMEIISIPLSLQLSAGTYYLEFLNGFTTSNQVLVWDNSGGSSSAYIQGQFMVGINGLPESQTFTIYGESNGSPVPEPSSLALLGTGLVGVVGAIRRKLMA